MRTFDAAACEQALPFDRLIQALHDAFVHGAEVPLRHTHVLHHANGSEAGRSLLMPAWQPGGRYGVKVVNIFPGNAGPALHAAYLLFDAATGAPLALLDGDVITARRTAAASALAARHLARPDARTLLVVGAGRVARLLPAAYRAVWPGLQVRFWARDPLPARSAAAACDAGVADDLPAAARSADIVACATLATAPLVHGAWLAAGSHLDLIGGFTPAMRECDDAAVAQARVFVDTDEALAKAGDLLAPMAAGAWSADRLQGTLAGLCRGAVPGRRSAAERTLFKSVGTALEDLAAADLVWRAAQPVAAG